MTNDLDRALIALRVSRDHGHGAVLNDAEVPALLAEIDRLTRERDEARAERDALRDVLLRHGFVPCDTPACNCGSWHHRYGLPERMQEIKDALAEAGHELSNANGNLTLNALKALVAERDELRRQLVEAQKELHNLNWALGTEGYDQMATPEEQAEHEAAVRAHHDVLARLEEGKRAYEAMKQDARRYRDWLRGGANIPPESTRWARWEVRHWDGRYWNTLFAEALDTSIDAAMGLTRTAEES